MLENYAKNSDGVVFQIEKKVIEYDQDYVNNSYVVYEPLPTYMGYLRLSNIEDTIRKNKEDEENILTTFFVKAHL